MRTCGFPSARGRAATAEAGRRACPRRAVDEPGLPGRLGVTPASYKHRRGIQILGHRRARPFARDAADDDDVRLGHGRLASHRSRVGITAIQATRRISSSSTGGSGRGGGGAWSPSALTPRCCGWLARKDSNLRSTDPELVWENRALSQVHHAQMTVLRPAFSGVSSDRSRA